MGVQSSVPVVPRYARHAPGWYAYGARTVLGAPRASCPVPLVRTARRRPVRVARTYSTVRRPRDARVSTCGPPARGEVRWWARAQPAAAAG
eukprot:scaffold11403_cov64-Phaeocystis_antarctica.AAC.3